MIRSLGALALAATVVASAHGATAAPTRIGYLVAGEDPALAARLRTVIAKDLANHPGYVLTDRLPTLSLVLFVGADVNSKVNAKGVSIAITIANSAQTTYLAYRLLQDPASKTDDAKIKTAVIGILNGRGMLDHVNVAHIDNDSDQALEDASHAITDLFFGKVPANASAD